MSPAELLTLELVWRIILHILLMTLLGMICL